MKKFLLLLFLNFFLTVLPVFAQNSATGNSNWGLTPNPPKQAPGELAEKVWDDERDEKIYQNYGSQESSDFLDSVESPSTPFEYDSPAGEGSRDPFENEIYTEND